PDRSAGTRRNRGGAESNQERVATANRAGCAPTALERRRSRAFEQQKEVVSNCELTQPCLLLLPASGRAFPPRPLRPPRLNPLFFRRPPRGAASGLRGSFPGARSKTSRQERSTKSAGWIRPEAMARCLHGPH